MTRTLSRDQVLRRRGDSHCLEEGVFLFCRVGEKEVFLRISAVFREIHRAPERAAQRIR